MPEVEQDEDRRGFGLSPCEHPGQGNAAPGLTATRTGYVESEVVPSRTPVPEFGS